MDHLSSAPRSLRDIAGTYRNARIGVGGEVRATLRVARAATQLWDLIPETVEEATDLAGLSIDVSA